MVESILIYSDQERDSSDELLDDLVEEISALDIGELEKKTQKQKDGTLPGIDLATVLLILSISKVSIEIVKAIIELVKEVRLRLADRKNVSVESLPKVSIVYNIEQKIILVIPSSKEAEKRFLDQITKELEE